MSLTVLATGTLVNDPQSRTSAAGKSFATALLRVPCEDAEPALVSLIAFSNDSVSALLAHSKGDSLSVAGRGKLTCWAGKDGQQAHGLGLVVDKALSAYMISKKRRDAEEAVA